MPHAKNYFTLHRPGHLRRILGNITMNKKIAVLLALAAVVAAPAAMAKDIKIQENSAGLSEQLTENLAATAVTISGSSGTQCNIKLNDGKIAGVSCK